MILSLFVRLFEIGCPLECESISKLLNCQNVNLCFNETQNKTNKRKGFPLYILTISNEQRRISHSEYTYNIASRDNGTNSENTDEKGKKI